MEPDREHSARQPGTSDPAHAPEGQDDPNPGDPGPPVLPSREGTDDPLRDPRLPEEEPPPRGV
jgi:hypothetical protein